MDQPVFLKLSTKVTTFLRECYIMSDLEKVKDLWNNAVILKGVHWERLRPLYKALAKTEVKHRDKIRYWDRNQCEPTPDPEIYLVREEYDEVYKRLFSQVFTVIPITPRVRFWNTSMSDWTVDSLLPDLKDRYSTYISGRSYAHAELSKLITQVADQMQIMINGVLYESPCQLCKNLFKRISGECPIIDVKGAWGYRPTMCSPRMILRGEMFQLPEEDTDLTDELTEPTECTNA